MTAIILFNELTGCKQSCIKVEYDNRKFVIQIFRRINTDRTDEEVLEAVVYPGKIKNISLNI